MHCKCKRISSIARSHLRAPPPTHTISTPCAQQPPPRKQPSLFLNGAVCALHKAAQGPGLLAPSVAVSFILHFSSRRCRRMFDRVIVHIADVPSEQHTTTQKQQTSLSTACAVGVPSSACCYRGGQNSGSCSSLSCLPTSLVTLHSLVRPHLVPLAVCECERETVFFCACACVFCMHTALNRVLISPHPPLSHCACVCACVLSVLNQNTTPRRHSIYHTHPTTHHALSHSGILSGKRESARRQRLAFCVSLLEGWSVCFFCTIHACFWLFVLRTVRDE